MTVMFEWAQQLTYIQRIILTEVVVVRVRVTTSRRVPGEHRYVN